MNEIKELVSAQYVRPNTRAELIEVDKAQKKYKELFTECTTSERRYLIIECEPNKDTPQNQQQLLTELKLTKFDKKSKALIALEESIIIKAKKLGIIANEEKTTISAEEVESSTSQG